MAKITIDGQVFDAEPGKMVIEVADQAGIAIPRFCYHKKLSVAANCRMCLVDVEKSNKPMPACATPVNDGMVVHTRSERARDAQKAVMEFLLINHPLDCPICDQGGQCELQDVAMGYGKDVSRYSEAKRAVQDKSLGPLVATDMTRCIHCTRCVRFTEEIAGMQELGTIGRGEKTEIGTCIEKSVTSELSGNIIDLCPVGALTSKPFRFRARAWELETKSSIAPHDCVGSHINLHVLRREQVMRVVPKEQELINENWLSDRDRFSYEGLNSQERMLNPMIKQHGKWQEVDWPTALDFVVSRLRLVISEHGPEKVGALLSPSASLEEGYLLQKMMRQLGSHNIDHRLQKVDFSKQEAISSSLKLPLQFSEFELQDTILIVGSHLNHEQPILAHRVRKAALKGADIFVLNPANYNFRFSIKAEKIVKPSMILRTLAEIIQALAQKGLELPDSVKHATADFSPDLFAMQVAEKLLVGKNKLMLLGAVAQNHRYAGLIYQLAATIEQLTSTKLAILTPGANALGLDRAGAVPHHDSQGQATCGYHTQDMFAQNLSAYILCDVEPHLDCANSFVAHSALKQAQSIIVIAPYFSHKLAAHAEVLLPSTPYTETSGTFVNAQGDFQSFDNVVMPQGESKPVWKILRVLANLLELDGFSYQTSHEVLSEMRSHQSSIVPSNLSSLTNWPEVLPGASEGIERLIEWPIYRSDSIVRRAQSLQETSLNPAPFAYLPIALANKLQLSADSKVLIKQGGGSEALLPVALTDNLAEDTIYVPAGFALTADLTSSSVSLDLQRS